MPRPLLASEVGSLVCWAFWGSSASACRGVIGVVSSCWSCVGLVLVFAYVFIVLAFALFVVFVFVLVLALVLVLVFL